MQRNIEIIEDLPLSATDAWYTLLVYLALKPGAWLMSVSSPVWRDGEKPRSVPNNTIVEIQDTFSKLDIQCHIERRISDSPDQPEQGRRRYRQICDIYIARDQAILDKIIQARTENDAKSLGIALGYPATAVQAFGTDQKLMLKDLDLKFQFSETGQMLEFTLSRDHWREEIAVLQTWIDALKQYSPIIYRRYKLISQKTIDIIAEIYGADNHSS